MESVSICCLKRLGGNSKHYKIISLQESDEVVIGRALDADVKIFSELISRRHAILKKGKNQQTWTITDNKSLNGILVNSKRLKPGIPHALNEGDTIQLGIPPKPSKEPPEFLWKFRTNQKVKKISEGHLESNSQPECRPREANENVPTAGPSVSPSRPPLKRLRPGQCPSQSKKWSPSSEMKQKLEDQEKLAAEKLRQHEERLAQMTAQLEQKEQSEEKMRQELLRRENEMQEEMRKHKEKLEMEKEKIQQEVRQAYEQQLKSKEESLMEKMESEKEKLTEERKKLEENLKEEVEQRTEMLREKEKLDQVIAQKESGMKMLQQQLDDVKTENLQQKETALMAKEDILSNFADLMETELQCSICNELFVQATSLNCAHSYCAYCIDQWMDVKKECPVCRAAIISHLRSIVLDSYIDKMVENLSEEMKERRKQLVQERKEEMDKRKAAAETSPSRRGGGRRRGRGRAGPSRSSPRRRTTHSPVRAVISSDSDSDSDDEPVVVSSDSESLSDSSVDGVDGHYYGGYGTCYNCGRRGHWANGCPY